MVVDTHDAMKKRFLFILAFLPLIAVAQFDFDSRYFTIDETSLPEAPQFQESSLNVIGVENKVTGSFTLDNTPTFAATMSSIKISSTNYWEPVDMMSVVSATQNYIDTNFDVAPLRAKAYGNYSYSADGASKVKNAVYMEVRGLDLLAPCPPYGICPRCAPYRAAGRY